MLRLCKSFIYDRMDWFLPILLPLLFSLLVLDRAKAYAGSFPSILKENTTQASNSTFLGPPDGAFHELDQGEYVTYELWPYLIKDGPGQDLNLYESGADETEFDNIDILVSTDGVSFLSITNTGSAGVPIAGDGTQGSEDRFRSYDLPSGMSLVRYVRVEAIYSGFDLDAVGAVHTNRCAGDFSCDQDVDGSDLSVFAADFGRTDCTGDCEGDFDQDQDVDGLDLSAFAADFGRTDCPPSLWLTDPNGWQNITAGTWHPIAWHGSDEVNKVDILLSLDLGKTYPISVAQGALNNGIYNWGPVPFHDPSRLSSDCKIKVRDSSYPETILDISDGVFALQPAAVPMTESVLHDMNEILKNDPEGVERDSDGDGLYDNVETYLGTDPGHWDTDKDSFADIHEVFYGLISEDPITDQDDDGKIKALDRDDDGDGLHDGLDRDTDLDSIADYLEIYGFEWDFGILAQWDGDAKAEYFKTNPNKVSSDRDPYSDYDEATNGPGMDDFVKSPGDHPNIATLPNIKISPRVQEGRWWQVTLNQEITTTEGKSVANGTEWSEDIYDLSEVTDEYHWEVTQEVSYSLTDFGGSSSVSYGQSHSEAKTTGTVRSEGGSILNTREWSTATCTNPLQAASIKFYLKAVNVGTCPVADPVLDVNLVIGGKEVLRFRLQDLPTLGAGDSYNFVLDLYNDFLPSKYLTLNELRLLDTGAPISFDIYEIAGGTVLGAQEQEDRWEYYQLNAEEVCARLFLDLGNGQTTEHLVYAGSGQSFNEPEVTLLDALKWTANVQLMEVSGVPTPHVRFYEPGGTLGDPAPFDGWYFKLDPETYAGIESVIQDQDFNFLDTVITSDSVVIAKAPPMEQTPRIHWATLSARDGTVTAHADDYFLHQSLLEANYVDKDGFFHPMAWNSTAGVFSGQISKYYIKDGTEKIQVHNPLYQGRTPGPCPWNSTIDPCPWTTEITGSGIGYVPFSYQDPYLLGSYGTTSFHDVFVRQDRAYLTNAAGLHILDISDPSQPVLIGSCEEYGFNRLFVQGLHAYVLAGSWYLKVVDIDPDSPDYLTVVASRECTFAEDGLGDVHVQGDYAYVCSASGELGVFDVSNPASPVLLGASEIYHSDDLYVQGDYAYVTAGKKILVCDVSDPTQPIEVGDIEFSGYTRDVFVQGSYAYVTAGDKLHMLDISDPPAPVLISTCDLADYGLGLHAYEGHAFVTTWNNALQVVDVRDPKSPGIVSSYGTETRPYRLFVQDRKVYMLPYSQGLWVIGFNK